MKNAKSFGGQQDKKPGQQHDPRQGQGGTAGNQPGNKPQQPSQKPGQKDDKGQW